MIKRGQDNKSMSLSGTYEYVDVSWQVSAAGFINGRKGGTEKEEF